MPREDRVKLLLTPALGPFRALIDILRVVPWPAPVQRLTQRGLRRLAARFPELAELLEGRSPRQAPQPQGGAAPVEAGALSTLLEELHARDFEVRVRAARGLAQYGEPPAVSALVLALRDRSVEVAVTAATSLSMAGGEQARQALLAVLDNAEGFYHPLTRAAAVRGLGTLLPPDQRAPLQRALRDLDAEVSIAAIGALGAQPGQESASLLLQVVENVDGFYLPITRLAAARALERQPSCAAGELEALRAREQDALVADVLGRLIERVRTTSIHA